MRGGLGVAVVALFASSGEVAHWTVFGVAAAVIALGQSESGAATIERMRKSLSGIRAFSF